MSVSGQHFRLGKHQLPEYGTITAVVFFRSLREWQPLGLRAAAVEHHAAAFRGCVSTEAACLQRLPSGCALQPSSTMFIMPWSAMRRLRAGFFDAMLAGSAMLDI